MQSPFHDTAAVLPPVAAATPDTCRRPLPHATVTRGAMLAPVEIA